MMIVIQNAGTLPPGVGNIIVCMCVSVRAHSCTQAHRDAQRQSSLSTLPRTSTYYNSGAKVLSLLPKYKTIQFTNTSPEKRSAHNHA
jgi:hypothetical protein